MQMQLPSYIVVRILDHIPNAYKVNTTMYKKQKKINETCYTLYFSVVDFNTSLTFSCDETRFICIADILENFYLHFFKMSATCYKSNIITLHNSVNYLLHSSKKHNSYLYMKYHLKYTLIHFAFRYFLINKTCRDYEYHLNLLYGI